ncbi:MAG: TnsA endonuclease N-terminal domain-containing protein [Chloroflexi bacterium]|nr:TnsA endonuclease N-terminal domain-containing protein [Chloroflexota bacterium]
MPVRTPSNRGGNTIGWFASYKMRRSIAYESLLECDYLYLLDFDEEVAAFEEQPLTITYQHAGRTHRYTPDFRVSQGGHELLIECKPLALVGTDENRRKFAAGEAWAAEHGHQFQVVTEREIRQGCRVENVRLLTQFARYPVEPAVRTRILGVVSATHGPLTLGQLADGVALHEPASAMVPAILHLAYQHELIVPLDDARITGKTAVWRPARQSAQTTE